ncbi:MAG: glycerophosphodiester phosphodiesterase [Gemmatimonadota bacterium]
MRLPHPVLRDGPLLIAHRGGSGLAPENTLAAFESAVSLWQSDMIELDVRTTRDGHAVVIHDPTVDRTTNGSGPVDQFTLAQLQALDAGYRFSRDGSSFPFRGKGVRVPTFDEVLSAVPELRITVEVKTASVQKPLFTAIQRAHAEHRIIAAGERRGFRTEFSRWTGCLSACREDAMPFFILHQIHLGWLAPLRVDVVQISEYLGRRRALTPRLIRELHGRGILVHVWTVNEIEDMHRLLDWGVDGILTDRPDRLAAVLHERVGRPLPPGLP